MLIQKSSNEAAVEAALCLGFLRPCNNTAQEFLLQCLCQGPMTQRIKVWGAGDWTPWGALEKQRPVLISIRSGPCLPYPIAKKLQQRTIQGPLCLSMCVCMSMGSCGRKCTCVCVYLICVSIHLCMCTYEFILTQEAKRQEKGPHLLPTSSRLSPQVYLAIQMHLDPVHPTHPANPHRHLGCWSRWCVCIQPQSSEPSYTNCAIPVSLR